MNTLGLMPSWKTAVLAHLVWIVPVVTLVIAIKVYSYDSTLEDAAADLGASRWQIFREVTLPLLWPGIWSGGLFAFCCPGATFRCRCTPRAPIPLCQSGFTRKWSQATHPWSRHWAP